ncbi:MAG: transglycosylase domain-containing protein [Chloroflexota bacterium]
MKKLRRVLLALLVIAVLSGWGVYRWLFVDLPAPNEIGEHLVLPSVRITDRYGRLLYDVVDSEYGRHTNLPLSEIPLALQQATIATEDKKFYSNPGVDLQGIMRAFWINLRGGEVVGWGQHHHAAGSAFAAAGRRRTRRTHCAPQAA